MLSKPYEPVEIAEMIGDRLVKGRDNQVLWTLLGISLIEILLVYIVALQGQAGAGATLSGLWNSNKGLLTQLL